MCIYIYVICENSPFRKFTDPFGPQPTTGDIPHLLAEGREAGTCTNIGCNFRFVF